MRRSAPQEAPASPRRPSRYLLCVHVCACACVTLFDHGPALQVPVPEDCTAVALRLPGVCIVREEQAQIFLDTEKTKAENKKIEVEKMESDENKAKRAMESDENKAKRTHAIEKLVKQQEANDKKAAHELEKKRLDLEVQKLEIEKAHELAKMQLESDLKNRNATATNAPVVPVAMCRKRKPATQANAPMVPLAIYKRSNTTTPLTAQQKNNKSHKAKQERLDTKAYRASLVSD